MAKNNHINVSESDTENRIAETVAITDNERYKGVTQFAYVGPSLPNGRLRSNTILSGTYAAITEYYKEAVTLYPNVAKLIVPVSQLAQAREKTQKSGNILYNYYTEIAAAINAKGEKK